MYWTYYMHEFQEVKFTTTSFNYGWIQLQRIYHPTSQYSNKPNNQPINPPTSLTTNHYKKQQMKSLTREPQANLMLTLTGEAVPFSSSPTVAREPWIPFIFFWPCKLLESKLGLLPFPLNALLTESMSLLPSCFVLGTADRPKSSRFLLCRSWYRDSKSDVRVRCCFRRGNMTSC